MFLGNYGAAPEKTGPLEATNGRANILPGSSRSGETLIIG